MLKIALSLAFLALASSSFAATSKAPVAPVCRSPDALIEAFTDATVLDDLKGDVLKKFNDAYTASTGAEVPSDVMDRVTIFTSKTNPDTEVYLMIISKDGCVIGAQPIPKQFFNATRHPGDGI